MAEARNRFEDQFEGKGQTRTGTAGDGGIMETVKEKAQDVASGAAQLAGQVKDTAQEWAGTAYEKAGDWAGTAYEKAEDWGGEATRLIRRYPLPALLISFGVGFLLAQATRRST